MYKALIFEENLKQFHLEIHAVNEIELLRRGDEHTFERIFKSYFKSLHSFAWSFLKDETMAEEVVQNVFCRIWEKKELLNTSGSLKAYLYRAVHNESLNYLKHQKVKAAYRDQYLDSFEEAQGHTAEKVIGKELERKIAAAINELPQQCRIVFQMSRFEHRKYHEIADQLGISIKTVENHMGKALKLMRLKLVEFLPVLMLLFFNYWKN